MTQGSRRREGWMWGVFLALAMLGGVVGFAQFVERGDANAAPTPLRLGEPGMPLGDPPERPVSADLPADFVPDLPAVPTLAPGTHTKRAPAEPSDDERLDELAAEMRLVGEARSLATSDPGGSLQLLDQHRARFPLGALREEREVYAIEALVALQRTPDAERRYIEFRTDFPSSTFVTRLERVMN